MKHIIRGALILKCAALFLLAILHGILVVPLSICLGAGMVGSVIMVVSGMLWVCLIVVLLDEQEMD